MVLLSLLLTSLPSVTYFLPRSLSPLEYILRSAPPSLPGFLSLTSVHCSSRPRRLGGVGVQAWGWDSLLTQPSCLWLFPNPKTWAILQAPVPPSRVSLLTHLFHFYGFTNNLCDDSSYIRFWFRRLYQHLYSAFFFFWGGGTFHTVTLVIPSKFTVSTPAQGLSHLLLFPIYMAQGGHFASSWYFFLTY